MNRIVLSGSALGIGVFATGLFAVAGASADTWSYVTLSSYYGYPGDSFTVNGYGFNNNEEVKISFNGQTTMAMVNGSGSFSEQMKVPTVSSGTYNVHVTGNGDEADANYTVGGYYGMAQPSSYYVLPRNGLSISGQSFMPNEPIVVMDTTDGNTYPAMNADANGSFSTQSYMVPYNEHNTTQNFTVKGLWSGSQINFSVTVGTYYPQITPSTYYVTTGSSLSVTGSGFGPFEGIRIFENGQLVAKATAGGDGSLDNVNVPVPSNTSSFTLTATGTEIGDTVSRTISVQQ